MKFSAEHMISWNTLAKDPERVRARLAAGETLLVMKDDEPFAVLHAPTTPCAAAEEDEIIIDDLDDGELLFDVEDEEDWAALRPRAQRSPPSGRPRVAWDDVNDKSQLVREAAKLASKAARNGCFTTGDVVEILSEKVSDVNVATVRVYLIRDTVNHSSRKHYPAGQVDLWRTAGRGYFKSI